MQSSNSTSPDQIADFYPDKPSTPLHQTGLPNLAELSPPNSQGAPLSLSTSNIAVPRGANANGKRPLSTVDNNGDARAAVPALRGGDAVPEPPMPVKTHAPSGYSWTKAEDEPGWSWKNKRFQEDANRAWESLVLKDRRIGSELMCM